MTREEKAIIILQNEQPHCGEKITFTEEERYEAYNMAIKALEILPKYKDAYGKGWEDGAKATYEHMKMCEEEQEPKADKALKLLAEWAIECGFGYDNIPEQYEKYKDDIADIGYTEGLAYIAQMESEGMK